MSLPSALGNIPAAHSALDRGAGPVYSVAMLALALALVLAAEFTDVDVDPRKRRSPQEDERKRESWYLTGLPLAAYDPNFGIGGGARAYSYFNGDRSDPLFSYTPYFHRLFLQGFAT